MDAYFNILKYRDLGEKVENNVELKIMFIPRVYALLVIDLSFALHILNN